MINLNQIRQIRIPWQRKICAKILRSYFCGFAPRVISRTALWFLYDFYFFLRFLRILPPALNDKKLLKFTAPTVAAFILYWILLFLKHKFDDILFLVFCCFYFILGLIKIYRARCRAHFLHLNKLITAQTRTFLAAFAYVRCDDFDARSRKKALNLDARLSQTILDRQILPAPYLSADRSAFKALL